MSSDPRVVVLQLRHREDAWQVAVADLFDTEPLDRHLSEMFEGLDDGTPLIVETRPADVVLEECLQLHERGCRETLAAMIEARPEDAAPIAARFETWWQDERARRRRR